MAFVEVSELYKDFTQGIWFSRRTEVLRNVSFQLEQGRMLVLVGPNGSGKSTLLKILSTLILPSQGTVRIGGFDVVHQERQARELISLVNNEDRSFFWRMSCYENLRFFGILNNLSENIVRLRIQGLAKSFGFESVLSLRYDLCSTGMKRRIGIARALMSRPSLLLLDEPTNSLDPDTTRTVHDMISMQLHRFGTTIIYITHHLREIEDFNCDVAVIKDGGFAYLRRASGGAAA